jgi:hypothetical protein
MKLALVVAMVAGMVGCGHAPKYKRQILVKVISPNTWTTFCVTSDIDVSLYWPIAPRTLDRRDEILA